MRKARLLIVAVASALMCTAAPQHCEQTLAEGWQFSRDEVQWQSVRVPHDWAIAGPFDKKWDLQVVAIKENGEDVATEHSGRSGSLPWIGRGVYRNTFVVPSGYRHAELVFDGAMADAHVYVNDSLAGHWAYGYNAFVVDVTPFVHRDGSPNRLEVRLNNLEESNRWYPGGGIYRPVKLVMTRDDAHLATWGLATETRLDASGQATLFVTQQVIRPRGNDGNYELHVRLLDDGRSKGHGKGPHITVKMTDNDNVSLRFSVPRTFKLWSPESPNLYTLSCQLYRNGQLIDEQKTRLGLRTLEWGPQCGGFAINGKPVKFRGVCLHHDLGPLGAAENRTAVLRQLTMMKDMGANAIRTSHNMPSTTMMELCDSMGLMVMAESFDAWAEPKVRNGYNRLWNEWWQRDISNLIRHHRNHPSIVMWSVGNEIPEQWKAVGAERYRALVDLCHSIDSTRPVTCGMDNPDADIACGFAQQADVPGYNYRVHRYEETFPKLPQGILLGSETASTVSTRGHYVFPDTCATNKAWPDGQCSGYDVEYCWWSNLPDDDWRLQDDMPGVIGEFVWTGFDYLGEPTPYDSYWPSRSSYFGIVDLAGLPKDRYWLYRSHWNKDEHTLHLLPHWTWPGREGQVTPVYCYSDYPSAELFVNGKSQGRLTKDRSSRLDRYRLRWRDVVYEPGELRVVAYDASGKPALEQTLRTAGEPARLVLEPEKSTLRADGNDLAYVTVSLVDKNGTLVPDADHPLSFEVKGAATYKAACNGDATSLEPFTQPTMRLFHGKLVVVVQAGKKTGGATLTVRDNATGLVQSLKLKVK
ncbi:MAG: DUF4982 domain-containing protein [Muribaculaceae bacterium]|nr:DUF4982 domain-containing protein [Muribaculaceae bacterium]